MKVLVLSCDTGGGHNACGRAVVEACRQRQIACGMDDAFRFVSPVLSRCVSYGFDRVYRYTPGLFGAGYRFSERHPKAFRRRSAAYRFWILGAKKLARLIRGLQCHVNLIPLNYVEESPLIPASPKTVQTFLATLEAEHISATVRREMGSDIGGACGQLRRRHLEGKA